MKSMTIIAFGLLVLVAIAAAHPLELDEEDEVGDELAIEVGDGELIVVLHRQYLI
jgi:hypothetical protein